MKIAITGTSGRIGRAKLEAEQFLESDENYRMFVVSGATLFQKGDCVSLKQSAESVLLERCPAICRIFESRGWPLPESIEHVYDSSKAQRQSSHE